MVFGGGGVFNYVQCTCDYLLSSWDDGQEHTYALCKITVLVSPHPVFVEDVEKHVSAVAFCLERWRL